MSYGTPSEIKADLVEDYVLVDTRDRVELRAELGRLGLPYSGDGPFRVELDGRSTHAVLKAIDTPLSLVQTHTPSLEDAYLGIVGRAAEDEAGDEPIHEPADA